MAVSGFIKRQGMCPILIRATHRTVYNNIICGAPIRFRLRLSGLHCAKPKESKIGPTPANRITSSSHLCIGVCCIAPPLLPATIPGFSHLWKSERALTPAHARNSVSRCSSSVSAARTASLPSSRRKGASSRRAVSTIISPPFSGLPG